MKEMIKKVKERREGFTMAELLIVVAIVAVLVAIAIPVFNGQLEKSKASTDAANIRAGYAEVASKVMLDDITEDTVYYLCEDSTIIKSTDATASTKLYKCKTASSNLNDNANAFVGSTKVSDINWAKDSNIQYSYSNTTKNITVGVKSTT